MPRTRVPPFVRELIIFAVLAILLWLVASIPAAHRHLYSYLAGQRDGLYSTLLAVEATLLGFIVAVLTIVLGYAQATRFEIVRRSRHWSALFRSYTRAMRWTAYATLSSLAGLLADRDSDPHPVVTALCAASLLMSAGALAWMLWITERVVRVVITPGARRPGE
jgi:hypothetical protein